MSEGRIYVSWPGGYFLTSLNSNFQEGLEEMVKELGPPTIVEYRDKNTGYIKENEE